MPGYGRFEPPFPLLPDENDDRSRSVGSVTEGHLVGGRAVPIPHPHLAFLPRQFERRLIYTGDPMVELLEDAAAHVGAAYPEAVIYLGNFSRRGGGNIPHSVSHNSGRDADIAFFVTDENGDPAVPPDLLPMDDQGRYIGADDEGDEEGERADLILHFDLPRNWRFVEGLIESEAADIQYIFVSNPLRRMLLKEGRRQNASAQTLRRARSVLVQPGGQALPHNDHFHLRIHCTARDIASGCRERGRPGPTFSADHGKADRVIATAEALLDSDHPHWRRTALLRLAMLDGHDLHERFLGGLDDPDPTVRAAAARAVASKPFAAEALAARLSEEDSPQVIAELIDGLTHHGDHAVEPLIAALQRDELLPLGPGAFQKVPALAADALARLERPEPVPHLIEALGEAAPSSRPAIAQALRILTNHRFASDAELADPERLEAAVQAWSSWYDDHGNLDRTQWLAMGFRDAGFDVDDLGKNDVWELCRAIEDARHLNFNAQRTLQRISGQSTPSLQWDPYDASFFWRRWFERRQNAFDLPPIPEELSTADGYNPP